jgi:cytochrome b6-f complex iron-sulfur subunit/menaquinol-cytochrome c reductase iron-sulfur subunit
VCVVTDDGKTSRRGALQTIAAVTGAAGVCALAVPTVRFLVEPAIAGAGGGRWIKTLPADSLPEGEPKRVALVADRRDAWTLEKDVELGAVWLLRKGSDVVAWSTVCPHLGCAVDKSSTGSGFNCPCHDSAFGPEGQRLNGPSPRGMDTLATKVEDGVVHVEFQRFRQGTPEKEPV